MLFLYAFFTMFIGGLISRMCGSQHFKIGYGLEQFIYALPYGLIVIAAPWWGVALSYLSGFAGKRTGHGGGLDMGTYPHPRSDERLEFIIKPLRGRMPEYWYDALLMAITGVAVSLVSGIVFALNVDLAWGIFLALSGASKAPAYMLGWTIYPHGHDGNPADSEFDEATELAELFTGIFGWGAVFAVYCANQEAIVSAIMNIIPAF